LNAKVTNEHRPRFEVNASLERADVAAMAVGFGYAQHKISGKASSKIRLTGRMAEVHTWRGEGEAHLYEADIYELPQMVSLLKLLSIRSPDSTAFTTSDATFQIQGDRIAFKRIEFSGDAISLRGTGWMGFDRQVDLNFYTLVGRDRYWIPLVRKLVAEASRNLLQLKVVGPAADPDIYRMPLPELDETIQRLFPELARLAPNSSRSAENRNGPRPNRSAIWR